MPASFHDRYICSFPSSFEIAPGYGQLGIVKDLGFLCPSFLNGAPGCGRGDFFKDLELGGALQALSCWLRLPMAAATRCRSLRELPCRYFGKNGKLVTNHTYIYIYIVRSHFGSRFGFKRVASFLLHSSCRATPP